MDLIHWLDTHSGFMLVPLVVGVSPIVMSLWLAAKWELLSRASGRHRGAYPYPTRPGLYADVPGWRGGILEIFKGVRHRGVYEPSDEWSETYGLEGYPGIMSVGPEPGTVMWTGTVTIPGPPDPEMGTAYLTLTPDVGGVLNIPAIMGEPGWGEPPPIVTLEDIERMQADHAEALKRERLAEINSLLCQHERVYHPVPA